MKANISKGNSKMGKVWNVSLAPVASCGEACKGTCDKSCYALKAYRMYPNVRKAWDANFSMASDNWEAFMCSIRETLEKAKVKPRFFRWHVAGDIQSHGYLAGMVVIAKAFPEIKFLAFTKQYSIVNRVFATVDFPENLQIVFSGWPGLDMVNPWNFPVAWMQDGTETRVPADALECPGRCDTCGMCFNLGRISKDVVFHAH